MSTKTISSLTLLVAMSSVSAVSKADFRGEVIYFALVDRFANGDPTNDEAHGDGVCNDKDNPHAFQGGDLAGLRDKLTYIAGLGATTVWISPLYKGVAAMAGQNCGFPGYWADFSYPYSLELDPRYGRAEEFDELIAAAHRAGLKIILDMVVNHAGYDAALVANKPEWFNDPSTCHERGPPEIHCPLAGLPDFDHGRDDVRRYLTELHLAWLNRFPFDGIRMDTVKHVEPWYFRDHFFPAMRRARPSLYAVGELLDENSFESYGRYLDAGFDGLFNFPLRSALLDTFAKGHSVDVAAGRMAETLWRFGDERAEQMVNLLDNHDVPRFLEAIPKNLSGDEARRRYLLALTALMALPGVPQLYYGNEVGMYGGHDPDNRRFMPEWAFSEAGRTGEHDGFLEGANLVFERVARLLAMRREYEALRHGRYLELWRQNGAANANVWAFARTGERPVMVALNNGAREPDSPLPVGVHHLFADGTILDDHLGEAGLPPMIVDDGQIQLSLPGRTSVILVPRR